MHHFPRKTHKKHQSIPRSALFSLESHHFPEKSLSFFSIFLNWLYFQRLANPREKRTFILFLPICQAGMEKVASARNVQEAVLSEAEAGQAWRNDYCA